MKEQSTGRVRARGVFALVAVAVGLGVTGSAHAVDGVHLWSKRLGGTSFDFARSVASDPSGNVLVAGESKSPSINLGGAPLTGPGGADIVLVKYSATGVHVWSKRLGGRGDDLAYSVASDPSGNVLVAGSSNSPSIDLVRRCKPAR